MIRTRNAVRRSMNTRIIARRLWLHQLENRSVPATFTVNLAGDAGTADLGDPNKGDIRYVIGQANLNIVDDSIVFDPAITAISLTSQLEISDTAALLIDGNGTVSIANIAVASASSRLFNISTTTASEIEFRGLTLKNGLVSVGGGGAIQAANTNLKLTNCTFDNNKSTAIAGGAGGALSITGASAAVSISGCSFSNNTAATTGGAFNIGGTGTATVTINGTTFLNNMNTGTTGGAIHCGIATTLNIGTTTGCTFTNNRATTNGGAINASASTVTTINNSTFSGNTAAGASSTGGAMHFNSAATLSATNTTIANNSAGGSGGGMRLVNNTSSVTLNQCSITGNVANSTTGGGVSMTNGQFKAYYCTFANNVATTTGGGVYATAATFTVINCTISGNEARGATTGGGGIGVNTAILNISNSTFVGNRVTGATAVGGGIRKSNVTGAVTINSTAIVQNSAVSGVGSDIAGTVSITVGGNNNFTGVGTSSNINFTNTPLTGNPRLAPLENYGGPTLTYGFRYNSPLIDHGNGTGLAGKTNDQRGTGFSRTIDDGSVVDGSGGSTDIGAVEGKLTIPWADAITGVNPVITPTTAPYTFTVIYDDETGINPNSLNNGELQVGGPGGVLTFTPTVSSNMPGPGQNQSTVAYAFNPPAGGWQSIHNGTYSINLLANTVFDNDSPTAHSNRAQSLGSFTVNVPLAAPPTLNSILINNSGDNQRSLVTNVKVTFSESVMFPAGIGNAFVIERTGNGSLGTVAFDAVQSGASVAITFKAGGAVNVDPGNSLQDGTYKLTVVAANVMGAGGTLDGDGDMMAEGSPTDNATLAFHRLFGDANGDGAATASDFNAFRLAYGGGPSIFDFDGDGNTTAADFNNFRLRYGASGYTP